jgi:glycosyltransferase involved in cell wall biosynthesis
MKTLMIVTNPFTHDPRVYNEAKSLVNNGNKVVVLAWDKKKEFPEQEIIDGIEVYRIYNSTIMYIIPYDLFRMYFWWKTAYKEALELYEKSHFDVIHCHDLDTLPIGIRLKKKLGLPLIYDAHEIWGYMLKKDLPKLFSYYYLKKEKRLITNPDLIITVNEPLKNYFESITNVKVNIIMNCKFLENKNYVPPKNDLFSLLYIGYLSKSRFLIELVEIISKLPNIHLTIGGSGKTKYVNALENKCEKIKNVDFIGKVPMEKVIPMTKKSDLIICMTSPDDPNNSRATGNKQFEAMVSGRPIICTKGTYPGILTEKLNCGLVAEFNKKSLKDAIVKLINNPKLCKELGKNALNAAIEKYNWKKQEEILFDIYGKIKP